MRTRDIYFCKANVFLAIALMQLGAAAPLAAQSPAAAWFAAHRESLVSSYQHLHAHPELSYEERETAAYIAKALEHAGFVVTSDVGGHGVVGLLKNGAGPTIMLRTDLDALPVTESTGLVYASKVNVKNERDETVGVMHACGHDVHMTNLIAVAQFMGSHKELWQGTLMMIGQPAEERGAGAKAMLEDGLFTRFAKPDAAVALHVDAGLAAGKIGYREGFAMANVNSVDITMHGKGGHGAYPQSTIDPVVQAAELVMSLQTIVSREVKPVDPAVITVGSIHGGSKHNVIGDSCHLQLTVRSYGDDVRELLLSAIERKAKAVALGARAPEPTIEFSEGTPALSNDAKLSQKLGAVFRRLLGDENVLSAEPSMGGEDFGRYGREGVPILMYKIGSVEQRRLDRFERLGQKPPSLHSAEYYPDIEPTLETGFITLSAAALELLPKK